MQSCRRCSGGDVCLVKADLHPRPSKASGTTPDCKPMSSATTPSCIAHALTLFTFHRRQSRGTAMMEVSRAGNALARSALRPTVKRAGTTAVVQHRRREQQPPQCRSRRAFSISHARRQPDDNPPSAQQSRPRTVTDDISSLLDASLDYSKGTPTGPASRTSRFKSPSAQSSNPPSRRATTDDYRPRQGSSVDDLWAAMGSGGRQQARGGTSGNINVAAMINPLSANSRPPPPPSLTPPEKTLPMKLNASVGRTIPVGGNIDPARAFRQLEVQCARNSVRRDFQRQRFHERPGLKRKRLKGERWRRRFREGFRGVVSLVQKMKKQGW